MIRPLCLITISALFLPKNCSFQPTPAMSNPTIIDSFKISPDVVYSELCCLNASKAHCPNSTTLSLLSIILYPCVICLNSLYQQVATLPFGWVSGNIVPIHKQNDKHIATGQLSTN